MGDNKDKFKTRAQEIRNKIRATNIFKRPVNKAAKRMAEQDIAKLQELDENGWAMIHRATYQGYILSMQKYIERSEDQLEFETGDDLHSTPLLLAVMAGNMDTTDALIKLGAKADVVNTQNHGVVELCALNENILFLKYFMTLGGDRLNVWKRLVEFMSSESDEESEAGGRCLYLLTEKRDHDTNPYVNDLLNNGFVQAFVKVIKSSVADESKIQAILTLYNIINSDDVKEHLAAAGGVPAIIRGLRSDNNIVLKWLAACLQEMTLVKDYTNQAVQNNAIPTFYRLILNSKDTEVLVEIIKCVGNICQINPEHKNQVGSASGFIQGLIDLYQNSVHKALLLAITNTIGHIVNEHEKNQNSFVKGGVLPQLIMMMRVKQRELQLASVDTIRLIGNDNLSTSKALLDAGAAAPLVTLLKKGRSPDMQEKTATALWALAGDRAEEQRNVSSVIGVQLLIEFLVINSEPLNLIGSEGLRVAASGPENKQTEIANLGGVHPLIRLLRSDKEYIVLSAIRTIRHLCVGVGFVSHPRNQRTVTESRGIKFLVALMVHSRNELIQVEAALTLGYVSLGNEENLDEIQKTADFNYLRILKLLYSPDSLVRLNAGSALAAFSYNNYSQQREIAEQGGIRFSCFVPYLKSKEEIYRCSAAFQVVCLARIIPDEEQAVSSSAGIKLLVDLLETSNDNEVLVAAADCVARLAHTRAGVPEAIISINAINLLCNLLLSESDQVRGCAAIAVGYLSYIHAAERQLLNRCRTDPYMIQVVKRYTNNGKLSPAFVAGWKHYKKIGLPPLTPGRPNLVGRRSIDFARDTIGIRPLTVLSTTSQGHMSPVSHGQQVEEEEESEGSRSSLQSSQSQASSHHSSLHSHDSRRVSMASEIQQEG